MGWNPGRDLKQLGRGINRAAIDLGKQFENLAVSPIRIAGATLKGDTKSIKKESAKIYGSMAYGPAANPLGYLQTNDTRLNKLAKSEGMKRITFGFSENSARGAEGYKKMSEGKSLSNEDNRHMLQHGVKAGVAALGGWYLGGSGGAGVTAKSAGANYLTAQGVAGSVAKGDYIGAVTGIGNLTGGPSIFPDMPKFEMPDWMKDIPKIFTGNVKAPSIQNPIIDAGYSQSSYASDDSNKTTTQLIFLAGLAGAAFILYKKGII